MLRAALVLSLAGCSPSDAGPSFFPGFSFGQPSDATGRSYDEVIAMAIGSNGEPGDIERYWREALPELDPGATYVPPTGLYPYVVGSPPDNQCGNALPSNAYFCPKDDSIAWDVDFFKARQRSIGDLAPLVILAHEWGHHIQHVWREAGNDRRAEAQADCYAGAYVDSAERQGLLDEHDYTETIQTWYQWGTRTFDEESWFSESEHGPGQARAWAFINGWITGDLRYCVSFETYEPGPPLEYEGYTLRVPPGSLVTRGADTGKSYDSIVGEVLSGYIQARPELVVEDATAALEDIAAEWFPPGSTRIIDVVDAFGATLGGSGALLRFEQVVANTDGSTSTYHGVLALHAAEAGGGFLVEAYRPGAAPVDDLEWDAVGDYVYLLFSGLCPDGAGTYVCEAP